MVGTQWLSLIEDDSNLLILVKGFWSIVSYHSKCVVLTWASSDSKQVILI